MTRLIVVIGFLLGSIVRRAIRINNLVYTTVAGEEVRDLIIPNILTQRVCHSI